MPPHTKFLYKVEEAAKLLGIGDMALRTLIRKGEIRHVKIGNALYVPATALDAFLGVRNEPPQDPTGDDYRKGLRDGALHVLLYLEENLQAPKTTVDNARRAASVLLYYLGDPSK